MLQPQKQIVQHINHFLWKNHVGNYSITMQLVANKTEQGSEHMLNKSASVRSGHCRAGAASYMLPSLCIHVWTLGCVQHNTLCKLKAIHITKCWHKAIWFSREPDTVTNTTLGHTVLISLWTTLIHYSPSGILRSWIHWMCTLKFKIPDNAGKHEDHNIACH